MAMNSLLCVEVPLKTAHSLTGLICHLPQFRSSEWSPQSSSRLHSHDTSIHIGVLPHWNLPEQSTNDTIWYDI